MSGLTCIRSLISFMSASLREWEVTDFSNYRGRIFATWSSAARAGALSMVTDGRTILKLRRRTAAFPALTHRKLANVQSIEGTTRSAPLAAEIIIWKYRSRDRMTCATRNSLKNLESQFL